MRICFVCWEYPPGPHGGIGTFTQVLSRELVKAGHHVRVAGVYRRSYPAPDYEVDCGVEVTRMRQPSHRFGWVSGRYRLFRKISQWCKRGELDLVEVPDSGGWAAGWPRLPVPVVARLNGSASYFAAEMGQPLRRRTYQLERASLQRADYWSSVSKYTAEKTRQLFSLSSGPHAILYNPVEVPALDQPECRSAGDVVFTGTLAYKKGVVSLVKAWPQVLEVRPDARLHLYGKDGRTTDGGSMVAMLRSMLSESQRETVQFHDHVGRQDLYRAILRARLAVFPSYAEAFALAPLEAMATGCPTIYSRRGSGSELIADGKDGLLIDPDDATEIADAILRLLQDDLLAAEIGAAGQQCVRERFTVDRLLADNLQFYEKCVGRMAKCVA